MINNNICKTNNSSSVTAFQFMIALIWTQNTVFNFIRVMLMRLFGDYSSYVFPLLLVLSVVFALPYIVKSIKNSDIMAYGIGVFLILAFKFIYVRNASYIDKEFYNMIFKTFSLYFVGLAYVHERDKNLIELCSIISIVSMVFYQFYALSAGNEINEDNMYASYNILPSVMYITYVFFKTQKISSFAFMLCGIFLVISYGTRGPLVAIIVFVIIALYLKASVNRMVLFLLAGLLVVIIFNGNLLRETALYLKDFLDEVGVSTRIFNLFLKGDITYSSGRDDITETIINLIKTKPLTGYGIMADRFYLIDSYAHNLFLELWVHFGVFFGSLIAFAFIYLPAKNLKKLDDSTKMFIVMLMCMLFSKLMFSGTYLTERYLYLMLGISVAVERNLNIKSKDKKCMIIQN